MGYSFRLAARVLLYASSHRQENTYHGLCYTSRGALAGTRNTVKQRDKDIRKRFRFITEIQNQERNDDNMINTSVIV